MADDTVTVVDAYRVDSGALRTDDETYEESIVRLAAEDKSSAEINSARAEVEQTRANIGETLSAIQEKLDPQALMAQAKETVQDVTANVTEQAKNTLHEVASDVMGQAKSTVHDVTTEVKETVGDAVTATKEAVGNAYEATKNAGASVVTAAKNNPLPTLLLLGGAYYLWSSWNSASARHRYENAGDNAYVSNRYDLMTRSDREKPSVVSALLDTVKRNPIPSAMAVGAALHFYGNAQKGAASTSSGSSVASTLHSAGETVSDTLKAAGEKAGDAVSGAKEAISGAVSSVKDSLGDAASSVQSAAGQAKDATGEFLGNVSGKVRDKGNDLAEYVQQNPLPAAAWALGIGALIAFLLPDTEPENRLYGKTRDNLLDTAQQSASELIDKVQSVSSKTLAAVSDTVKQEAQNQGLTTPQPS